MVLVHGYASNVGEFGLNILIFDDDDDDENLYWLQLAPGLTDPVNTKLYPRFVLAK